MKHTKGPWFQSHSKCSDGMYRTKVYNKDVTICTLDWAGEKTSDTTTTSRRGENALLISKAPEMIEALNWFINSMNDGSLVIFTDDDQDKAVRDNNQDMINKIEVLVKDLKS